MSVLWKYVPIVSLLQKHGTTLLCKLSHHDRGGVDLLYIMVPGETGFLVQVSVWNVTRAKCDNHCGK